MHYGYPFAETEKLPPPVVLLLLQTDLNVSTSTGLVIHEDLDNPVPSAKKTVVFAPVLKHAYPPPPMFEEKIPTPTMLTRKVIKNHAAWEGGDHETIIIKTTVHALVDKLLDTTKSLSDQDPELVQEVFLRATQMHPDLGKYENTWATYRVQTIIATIEIKTGEGNTGDVVTWRRLLELAQHLGQQGMSSEEEDEVQVDDAKVLIYKVKVCIWHEPRVVEYLRFVDAQTGLFKKHQ
ncbi:hypothetical protein B0H14DRAFT_3489648 [Mycena olivaceomarginata]|nr:hypothetical protein B0H14DRAFT_3489648 [Mycena olivaceomarginata]